MFFNHSMTASVSGPCSVPREAVSSGRIRAGVVDREWACAWAPAPRGCFRAVGFAMPVFSRARSVEAVPSGCDRRGAPADGAVVSVRVGRDVEIFFRGTLPRDTVAVLAAGCLGGSGRLRGSRPDAASEGAVLDLWATAPARADAWLPLPVVVPRERVPARSGPAGAVRPSTLSGAPIHRNYPSR